MVKLLLGHLRKDRQRQNPLRNLLSHREIAPLVPQMPKCRLKVQWNRVMDTSFYAAAGKKLSQSVARIATHREEMMYGFGLRNRLGEAQW